MNKRTPSEPDDAQLEKLALEKGLIALPTGKRHVSYSEMRDWSACSFRHKLKYVSKVGLDLDETSPHLEFGTAIHASCEDYLRTREMKASIAEDMIRSTWEKNRELAGFGPGTVDGYVKELHGILDEVPDWLEKTFPGWEFVDAEHYLYERIDPHPYAFKGYVDGIIRCRGPRGRTLTWLLDWKSSGWGWHARKKSDPAVCAQLVLYKSFWASKTGTDPKDVRCGFVLLKRTAKPGSRCELVATSVGELTTRRSLQVVNNMISSVKRGIAIKNRGSCDWCQYKDTEHCT